MKRKETKKWMTERWNEEKGLEEEKIVSAVRKMK